MTIVIISDSHGKLGNAHIPDGDVLIHCGDATCDGTFEELEQFTAELAARPHKHKLIIPGNHDYCFEQDVVAARRLFAAGICYLCNSGVTIDGVNFWGAPWTPGVDFNFSAFTLPPGGSELSAHWGLIPSNTGVLITHGPPAGILDTLPRGNSVGCRLLRHHVALLQPAVHCYGHVHGAHGRHCDPDTGTLHVNAAICGSDYELTHPAEVVELQA